MLTIEKEMCFTVLEYDKDDMTHACLDEDGDIIHVDLFVSGELGKCGFTPENIVGKNVFVNAIICCDAIAHGVRFGG